MSAISIQSSGSGAGTLTVAAPITANNYTLTLPQATGTLGAYPQIYPITASVASNALTVTLNPCVLDFRSTPLTSGTVNTRTVSAAISVTVASGATLGAINATQSRIVVLAIDNAGTVELAVVNIAGGNNLDETTLISTTALSATSDLSNIIYSTTARTSLPYRVVGYVESTQTTAGTWAAAPSTIQGYGGQALAAMSSIGYSQTWQAVTRTSGTTYYNTTGKPIYFAYSYQFGATGQTVSILINGVQVGTAASSLGNNSEAFYSGIIPAFASYSVTISASATAITTAELR